MLLTETMREELTERGYCQIPRSDAGTTVANLIDLLKQMPQDLAVVGTCPRNGFNHFADLRAVSIDTQVYDDADTGQERRRDTLHLGF